MDQTNTENSSALPGWFSNLNNAGGSDASQLGTLKKSAEHLANIEKIKGWTRERFTLAEGDVILVSEIGCTIPGCPPLETVVAFWTEDKKLHHFKLFKPLEEVVYDDLPWAWLMDSLADGEGFECC